MTKNPPANARDTGSVPGLGRSLEKEMANHSSILDRGAWEAIVHRVTKSQTSSYMTTGKIIALTIQIFVGKVTSLRFNMLSRFVIAFLSRSKHLLISWLQSLSTVILEPKKIKFVIVSTFSPSIWHEVRD